MNYWLFLVPVISAAIGWLGSRIAGKILVHRVIPDRKDEMAQKIGEAINKGFPFADIEKKITDPANIKKIMPLVEDHIDDFLRYKLKDKMPVVGLLIGDKTINSLKQVFLKEIEDLFPQVLKQFAGNFQTELNIGNMAAAKVTAVSSIQIEKVLTPLLLYFRYAGIITGFLIGIIDILVFIVTQ